MKNILITGGAGFIGSHLVDLLLAESGWNVSVLDNFDPFYSPVIKYRNIARHTEDARFTLYGGDITSMPVLESIFANRHFDCIVHFAAQVGARQSLRNPFPYEKTNVRGTLNLLEVAKNYGIKKFIYASSSSVYGGGLTPPFTENMCDNKLNSPYAVTKAAAETLCYTYSYLYDLRCVCLRLFNVYGPRQRPDLAIHKFARLIEHREPVTMYGDGTTMRDYTHILDVLNGLKAALEYDASNFEIFNIGSGRGVKLYDLIKLLEKVLNRKAVIERVPLMKENVKNNYSDIGKARKLFGYDSKITLEWGVENFVRWFKSEENLDYENYASENPHNFDFAGRSNASGLGKKMSV
jgi:UDP-glucuronate 4-epimerase